MKRTIGAGAVLLAAVVVAMAQQKSMSDEGGRVLALEKAWNLALEEKDAKALDMLLANTLVSVDIDGSVASKSEFLASIKAPDYKPSQVITEQTRVQVYGNAAVVTGTFRVKGTENAAKDAMVRGFRSFAERPPCTPCWPPSFLLPLRRSSTTSATRSPTG